MRGNDMSALAQRYRMYHVLCLCFVLGTILPVTESRAHGLTAKVSHNNQATSTVTFHYSDGSPASYTAVKVYSPVSETVEFQNGRTDKNGRFSFTPDAKGLWRIRVNDGMGHAVSVDQELDTIGEVIAVGSDRGAERQPSRFTYAILGCSLVMNIGFTLRTLKRAKAGEPG